MWKILVNIGFDYVVKHFFPRIKVSGTFAVLFERLISIGKKALDKVTDGDPNNAAQLQALWRENEEEIISSVLAGVVTSPKQPIDKLRIIAILEDTAEKLKSQLPAQA